MNIKRYVFSTLFTLSVILLSSCQGPADEADDWTTYHNDKYGYSFKYPSDCFFGPMPKGCKQKPPEERAPECLCFVDAQNPDQVFLQKLDVKADTVSMASFGVSHFDTPQYNPPAGVGLVPWLEEQFSDFYQDIPSKPNFEIQGNPAIRIYTPASQGAQSSEGIFFIREDKLFQIYMLHIDIADNKALYDQMVSSFTFE